MLLFFCPANVGVCCSGVAPGPYTSGQSELLQRLQKLVLRSLLQEAKYSEALAATGLATLEQRWVELPLVCL